MDFEKLCCGIHLQQEMKEEAVNYYRSDEFQKLRLLADGLRDMASEAETRELLGKMTGPDRKKIRMLTYMLACAVDLFEWYQKKGISETIFLDAMSCFTRFIDECKVKTGEYAFDREWWTARQVSGNLFRIGTLEYEMRHTECRPVISIHIPSDANLIGEACDESVSRAHAFFEQYFPEFKDADYVCSSWLLAPALKSLLKEDSHILAFQSRFDIWKTDEADQEFLEWVFQTKDKNIASLPENTSLQKNMKRHLLNGGKIGSGSGVLR